MRTKSFRYGKTSCKTYMRTVGNGWETGFVVNNKTVFVGNFIHSSEANRWFGIMNREISRIGRKFTVGHNFPTTWFAHFISNDLYKIYYAYLDKLFTRYTRTFNKAVVRDMRSYRRMKNRYNTDVRKPYLKSA